MTSKELRKAAELSATECFQYFEEYHEEDHDDPDSKQHYERIDMMAAHIIYTVREDDGEEIDEVWFNKYSEYHDNTIELGDSCQFYWDGTLLTLWYQGRELSFHGTKTRGDLRQLCRLLGVKLKEQS